MRRSETLASLAPGLALFLVIILIAWAAHDYLSMPTIYRSYTTGECVKVEGCDCNCFTLPGGRAHTVWVQ